jgi:hypothetical protein
VIERVLGTLLRIQELFKRLCDTLNFMAVESVNPTPEDLQKKVYFLLEQLQLMARELPP